MFFATKYHFCPDIISCSHKSTWLFYSPPHLSRLPFFVLDFARLERLRQKKKVGKAGEKSALLWFPSMFANYFIPPVQLVVRGERGERGGGRGEETDIYRALHGYKKTLNINFASFLPPPSLRPAAALPAPQNASQ